MSTEIKPEAIRDQDEAISLSYWLAEKMGEHVDDQGDETLTETVQRYVSREWMPKTGATPAPAPLDPSADDALAASLQRLGKVWGEYRDQQVRGAAKALDVVAASVQQVVDAANAVHQPAPEAEPLVEGRLYEVTAPDGRRGRAFYKPIDGIRANHPWVSEDETRYRSDAVTDVRSLVVIDPAAVDVVELAKAAWDRWDGQPATESSNAHFRDIVRAVLSKLGLEEAR